MAVTREDLRRRVMGWQAAERREQALRAREGPPAAAAAFDAALELHDMFAEALDEDDVVVARELANARAAWRKLRDRLACPVAAPPR